VSWIDVDVQGRKIRVAIVRSGNGAWVSWSGQSRFLGPERTNSPGSAVIEREIRAPMTGRVLCLSAAPGSKVRANDVLAILEAMKMEYRLVAPRDGVVESVGCNEGDRVDLGRVIVVLEP
jgi:3-methylcrotonyl-CoA carboxylase alpha subunit